MSLPPQSQASIIMQPSGVKIQSSSANISSIPSTSLANSSTILPSGIPVTMSSSDSIVATSNMSGVGIGPQTPPQQQRHPQKQQQPLQMLSRVPLPPVAPVRAAQGMNTATSRPPPPPGPVTPTLPNGVAAGLGENAQAANRATPTLEAKSEKWMDLLQTGDSSGTFTFYFSKKEKQEADTPVCKDLECSTTIVGLSPGTCYKFRVAAVNPCGRSPWSEVSTFKTCLPGFPEAPNAIKIYKSVDGCTIAWEPQGDKFEYSVHLAVKPPSNAPEQEPKPGVTNLFFRRVYYGPSNSCNVSAAFLNQALVVTTSTKPVIVFRIQAKNDKGCGPVTQVRWLQESVFTTKTEILKGAAPPQLATSSSVAAKSGKADGKCD